MHEEYLNIERISLKHEISYPQTGLVIADEKVVKLYPDLFFTDASLPTLYLRAGERQKSWNQCLKVYDFLAEHQASREDIIHVFGGGTACDLAAFAISTFKRGCRLYLYPTTLLAMVDAAIGGKTGINYLGFKNYIGSFYPAERIFIYPPFLQSLATAELRQGYAEMLKCSMLNEDLLLPELDRIFPPRDQLILDYARYKMGICAQDPYDNNQRQLLNFGHTFGHALESFSNYKIKHGDAIVLGMYIACEYSFVEELSSAEEWEQYRDWISQYPIPKAALSFLSDTALSDMLPQMLQDKKWDNQLRLVVPVHGEIKIIEVEIQADQADKQRKNNAHPA